MKQEKQRVLIASPVRQKKLILAEFLESLAMLDTPGAELSFIFIDDNNDHDLLTDFARGKDNVRIFTEKSPISYFCDETTHYWREELIWKVAAFKDRFIELALAENYEYLFLIDSDLYLQPQTLSHLLSLNLDIVSEVFWTRWDPNLIPLPQVWVTDQYRLYQSSRGETLSEEEENLRTGEFLNLLSKPGTYKVGGLGACTLISRRALLLGVSFKELYNISFVGEDRHFCIRAAALGLELYADTHCPPFHIYRESELPKLQAYKKQITKDTLSPDLSDNLLITLSKINSNNTHNTAATNISGEPEPLPLSRILSPAYTKRKNNGSITLAMLVKNEAGRYLEQVLEQAAQYIDRAVILDDASEDDTVEVCRGILKNVPLTLVSNRESYFNNEIVLRKQLWQMALETEPDWIIILDADEIFEAGAPEELRKLAQQPDIYYYSFRLYDMWDETHYREDEYWNAHRWYRPFWVRYQPGFSYIWKETPQHCGRFPINLGELRGETSELRIKHLGWMRPKDRLNKYFRYKKLDPQSIYGIAEQYSSILAPRPNLVPWIERLPV